MVEQEEFAIHLRKRSGNDSHVTKYNSPCIDKHLVHFSATMLCTMTRSSTVETSKPLNQSNPKYTKI